MRKRAVLATLITSKKPYDGIEVDLSRIREEVFLSLGSLVDILHNDFRNLSAVSRVFDVLRIDWVKP